MRKQEEHSIPFKIFIQSFSKKDFLWKRCFRHQDTIRYYIFLLLGYFDFLKSKIVYYPYLYSPCYLYLFNYLRSKQIVSDIIRVRSVKSAYVFNVLSHKNKLKSTGTDSDPDKAVSKAIGEFLERWVISLGCNSFLQGSYSSMKKEYGENIYYPPPFHGFLSGQKHLYKELISDENSLMEWGVGYNLITKEKVLLPKESLFLNTKRSTVIMHSTTNGCAGYFSQEGAIVRALLEVVERDSFLVHWLTKIPPLQINLDSLPKDIHDFVDILSLNEVKVVILDVTTDLSIPSICVVLKTLEYDGKITVAAGSGVTYREATLKAITEAFSCLDLLSRQGPVVARSEYTPFSAFIGKEERTHMWQGKEWMKEFEWFLSGSYSLFPTKEVVYDSDINRLNHIKTLFSYVRKEYVPYVYEYHNNLLKDVGYYVVRVIIPLALPMFLDERYGAFASDRLDIFATYKGITSFDVNRLPHPFP